MSSLNAVSSIPLQVEIECKDHHFIADISSGFYVCCHCGIVSDDILYSDQCPFDKNSDKSFIPLGFHRSFPISTESLCRALTRNKIIPWKERRINIGINEIRRLNALFGPNQTVLDRAIYLLQKILKIPEFSHHYITLIALVSFYYAAQENGWILSFPTLIGTSNYRFHLGHRYLYQFTTLLRLKSLPKTPSMYLPQVCNWLGFDQKDYLFTEEILQSFLSQTNISGLNMKGIIAGVVFLACELLYRRYSQRNIAELLEISDITLRTRYKEIKRHWLFNQREKNY